MQLFSLSLLTLELKQAYESESKSKSESDWTLVVQHTKEEIQLESLQNDGHSFLFSKQDRHELGIITRIIIMIVKVRVISVTMEWKTHKTAGQPDLDLLGTELCLTIHNSQLK
jgi:alpha-tubulin suppressor-like RCC1 family protein